MENRAPHRIPENALFQIRKEKKGKPSLKKHSGGPFEGMTFIDGDITLENPSDDTLARLLEGDVSQLFLSMKSSVAQCLIEITPDKKDIRQTKKGGINMPATLSYLGTSPYFLSRFREAILQTRGRFNAGSLYVRDPEKRLTKEEVQDAREAGLLWIPEKTAVAENGEILIPMETSAEFILPEELLENPNVRDLIRILEHGRSGLGQFQSTRPRDSVKPNIQPKEALVSGMRLSVGPFLGEIRPQVSENIMHLAATRLDPLRTTGVNGGTHPSRLVQLELYHHGESPVDKSDIAVPVSLYPSENPKHQERFNGFTPKTRERVHYEGTSLIDTLDPEVFEEALEALSADFPAFSISGHGVVPIPQRETYKHQKDTTLRCLMDASRTNDHRFEKLQKALKETQHQGRILVADRLGSISHLERLFHEAGVRHIVVRGLNMNETNFNKRAEEDSRGDFYLDSEKHARLIRLEQKGLKIYWVPTSGKQTESLREFYKGVFIKPEKKDQFDQVRNDGMVIPMFGASVESLNGLLAQQIEGFAEHVKNQDPNIAIIEGNGPGVMEMSSIAAQKQGLFTIGLGMDFEEKGETPRFTNDAIVLFKQGQIEWRQTFMENFSAIPVINLGGIGTFYEIILPLLRQKINSSLPVPIVLVDPTGSDFYEPIKQQVENMTQRKIGEIAVDRPLAPEWVAKVSRTVKNYDEAWEIIASFIEDPIPFWKEIGTTPEQIKSCLTNHLEMCRAMQIEMPKTLKQAAEKFIKEG